MEKISYALGLSLANNLLSSGIRKLDIQKFAKAVEDVYSNNAKELSYEEATGVINEYFEKLQAENNKGNIEAGKAFLEKNKNEQGVITLPSGLQYQVIKEGNGKKPTAADNVRCHYHGTLIDGTVFDSSVQRGEPAVFGVGQVIQGWVEALQLMPEGSTWRLFIPSELAYGSRGAGQSIAPYSTLVFDVELLEIV